MSKTSPPPVPTPHTRAWLAYEQNFDSIIHMAALQRRELSAMSAAMTRYATLLKKYESSGTEGTELPPDDGDREARIQIITERIRELLAEQKKVRSSWMRFLGSLETSVDRLLLAHRWQVVMLVTCVEAYLQDVLSAAASVDPSFMKESEQAAKYADVIAASSIEELANEMRAKWARNWIDDGGPTRWIDRLGRMGARGYPADLAPRLEPIWGIRHVVVHRAGIATADFVKRHPGVVKAVGDPVMVRAHDMMVFAKAAREFTEPTEAFFLARYPSLAVEAPTAPAK